MIDFANPTLNDALWLGFGLGSLLGVGVGLVVSFILFHWLYGPVR